MGAGQWMSGRSLLTWTVVMTMGSCLSPGSSFPEPRLHTTPCPAPTPLPLGCTWLLASPAPPSYTHDSIWPENESLLGNYKAKRSSSTTRFQVNSAALLRCHLCACSPLLPHPIETTSSWAPLPAGHTLHTDGAVSGPFTSASTA